MRVDQVRMIYCYTLEFIAVLYLLPAVDASAYFTKFPSKVSYVSSGGTARFEWKYHVDDRSSEFQATSPVWSYYNQSYNKGVTIGFDDKRGSWSFFINRATCPPRLLTPDRVSRELPATLVISRVTTADNGIYQCSLMLTREQPIIHQVQLIVTVTATFQPKPPLAQSVAEGQDLNLPCTAIGAPTPNITWVQIVGYVILSTGTGGATLRILNIRRDQNGTYECQARNNPNESPVTTQTVVTVHYKPAIDIAMSSLSYNAWNGKNIRLRCIAGGLPSPRISWYKPNNKQITMGVNTLPGGSEVTVRTTTDQGDYGQYKCRATNNLGSDEHGINVTQNSLQVLLL